MSEEERRLLWQAKINAIEETRYLLTKCLNPQSHYAFLRTLGFLSFDDQEKIHNTCSTTAERSGKLLDVIVTKGPGAFDALYNSIKSEGTQAFLLQELNRSLERQIKAIRNPSLSTVQSNVLLLDDNLPGPTLTTI